MVGLVPLGSGLIVCTAVRPVMSMLLLLAPTVQILWVASLTGKWFDGLPVSVEECNLGAKVLLCLVLVNPVFKRAIGKQFTEYTTPFLPALTVFTMLFEGPAEKLFRGLPFCIWDGEFAAKVLPYILFAFAVFKRTIGKLFTWRTGHSPISEARLGTYCAHNCGV